MGSVKHAEELTLAHQFRILLWRVVRRGTSRTVLPMLVLALAATALPAGRAPVQSSRKPSRSGQSATATTSCRCSSKAGCNRVPATATRRAKGGFASASAATIRNSISDR